MGVGVKLALPNLLKSSRSTVEKGANEVKDKAKEELETKAKEIKAIVKQVTDLIPAHNNVGKSYARGGLKECIEELYKEEVPSAWKNGVIPSATDTPDKKQALIGLFYPVLKHTLTSVADDKKHQFLDDLAFVFDTHGLKDARDLIVLIESQDSWYHNFKVKERDPNIREITSPYHTMGGMTIQKDVHNDPDFQNISKNLYGATAFLTGRGIGSTLKQLAESSEEHLAIALQLVNLLKTPRTPAFDFEAYLKQITTLLETSLKDNTNLPVEVKADLDSYLKYNKMHQTQSINNLGIFAEYMKDKLAENPQDPFFLEKYRQLSRCRPSKESPPDVRVWELHVNRWRFEQEDQASRDNFQNEARRSYNEYKRPAQPKPNRPEKFEWLIGLLGLSEEDFNKLTLEEVKKLKKKFLQKWHPDVNKAANANDVCKDANNIFDWMVTKKGG